MRAEESLDQAEENGAREKRMSAGARCAAELTGSGLDRTWSVALGSTAASWPSDPGDRRCGAGGERGLDEDPGWGRRS